MMLYIKVEVSEFTEEKTKRGQKGFGSMGV